MWWDYNNLGGLCAGKTWPCLYEYLHSFSSEKCAIEGRGKTIRTVKEVGLLEKLPTAARCKRVS
jgi:hypothetical protein